MLLYTKYQEVFQEFGISELEPIAKRWREKHRFYHNETHLRELLKGIESLYEEKSVDLRQRNVLLMAAYFHDVIYDPTANDNEEQSAVLFNQLSGSHPDKIWVKDIILDTKEHQPKDKLSVLFSSLDMKVVQQSNFVRLLEWEKKIFKEYQFVDYQLYKSVRISVLQKFARQFPENSINLLNLAEYVSQFRPRVGIYPGSFNPFHKGHLNVLEKAERIFDKVIVARGINPDKTEVNTDGLNVKALKYRQFENFTGFLTDYLVQKEKYCDVTVIRGLRNGADLDYEVNQLRFMEDMKSSIQLIFIRCDKEYEHISSSAIKNLEKIQPDFSKKYLPD